MSSPFQNCGLHINFTNVKVKKNTLYKKQDKSGNITPDPNLAPKSRTLGSSSSQTLRNLFLK